MSTRHCDLCGNDYAANLAVCPVCGVGPAADFPLPMGTELQGGKFTVGKVLGRGGFGITYKGTHQRLQRPVAIKELFPEFATRSGQHVTVATSRSEGFRREQESVVQEARIIANLKSHNIVDVDDFFHENGTIYIVMEYLEGPTLEQEIERLGQLPAGDVARVADEVCGALDTMHRTNLLHRDVKPANILLTRDGRAVLIDFGSAREFEISKTQSHTRLVTLNYAAPEQFSQMARFGPYTDLFCLGATLYHALIGVPPTSAMDRLQTADQTVPLPSAVPDGLRQAVQGALNCQVEDRPQSVKEFRALLGSKKSPPARRTAVSAARTQAVDTNHDGVPYEFRGEQYYTPKDLNGRWILGGSGASTLLLGLLLLARPDWGTTVFYTVLGVYLALMGVANLWDGLRRRCHPSRNRLLLGGALSLLAGIAAIANPIIALAVFPDVLLIVAGVLAILFGVVQMSQFRVRDWDGQAHIQWGRAAVGVAAIGLGVLVIANPVASILMVVRAVGVALMAVGVLLLVLFGYLHRNRAV